MKFLFLYDDIQYISAGTNMSLCGCLMLCVSPVMNCRPRGVPNLSPNDSWKELKQPLSTHRMTGEAWMDGRMEICDSVLRPVVA